MEKEVIMQQNELLWKNYDNIEVHYCPRNSFNISKSNKLIVTHQN